MKKKIYFLISILISVLIYFNYFKNPHENITIVTRNAPLSDLNAAEKASIEESLKKTLYSVYSASTAQNSENSYYASNPANKYHVDFHDQQIQLLTANPKETQALNLKLKQWGYQNNLQSASVVQPISTSPHRIEYHRGSLTEWYVNDPSGLEQGFTLHSRPPLNPTTSTHNLEVHLAISGDLKPTLNPDKQSITLKSTNSKEALEYGGLYAYDATGKKLPSEMFIDHDIIGLRVNDANATYPVVIDPKFNMGDYGLAGDLFGNSVAIDDDTVVVGAPYFQWQVPDSKKKYGAAFVYIRSKGTWIQNQWLQAPDSIETDRFGWSVSISSNTIAIGNLFRYIPQPGIPKLAPSSVYIFIRTNNTAKFSYQKELVPIDSQPGDAFGYAVDIDGDKLVVGAPNDVFDGTLPPPSAYLFIRANNVWKQETNVTHPDGYYTFAASVAIDKDIFVVGAEGSYPVNEEVIPGYITTIPTENSSVCIYSRFNNSNVWALETNFVVGPMKSGHSFRYGASVDIKQNRYEANGLETNLIYTLLAGMPGQFYGPNQNPWVPKTHGYVVVSERKSPLNSPSIYSWQHKQLLAASDSVPLNDFGESVAIGKNLFIVGCPNRFLSGVGSSAGGAYIFRDQYLNGNWKEAAILTDLYSPMPKDFMGNSVAIDGITPVVGIRTDSVTHTNLNGTPVEAPNQGSAIIGKDLWFPSF